MSNKSPTCHLIPGAVAHYRPGDLCWHGLPQHLRGTGILTRRFACKIGLPNLGELMGLLHDLGKYSSAFQHYLLSAVGYLNPDADDFVNARASKGRIDHSSAGAQFIWRGLAAKGRSMELVAQWLALCIASHHSGLTDCITPDGQDRFGQRMDKPDSETHCAEAEQLADPEILHRIRQLMEGHDLAHEVMRLVDRIKQRSQSLGLTKGPFRFIQLALAVRFSFSCLVAGDRIDTAHFGNPSGVRFRQGGSYHYWDELVKRLEWHLATMPVRHAIDGQRQAISAACRDAASRPTGIYTLSVPTGGGKTLASLRFALHHAGDRRLDRVIYITPYTSIIDQNAEVVRGVLEPGGPLGNGRRVLIEHHSNLGAERQTYEDKLLCDDWDAPIIYTTMVQFLETLFGSGTRGVRRMHQLANAVLIFDEVQTVPMRCVHLFNQALNFLVQECGSTIVLCTATQPLLDRVDASKGALILAPHAELMPDADGLFRALKRVDVRDRRQPEGWSHAALAELAIDSLREQSSCLVIVNTKKAARGLYQKVVAKIGTNGVFHLSTDMCPKHRKQVLGRVTKGLETPGQPVLCISTQLIEAGVDVDFRVVVRFLAGLDSIAQAAGRCNRHGRSERGQVHIVNPDQEDLRFLPDIQVGRDQAQVVLDRYRADPKAYDDDRIGRRAMQEYYELYFFQRKEQMSYLLPKERFYGATLLELLSSQDTARDIYLRQQKRPPPYYLLHAHMSAAQAFKSIDVETESVIVPFGEEGKELVLDLFAQFDNQRVGPRDPAGAASMLRLAQQYTVNVYPWMLARLYEMKVVTALGNSGVYCLDGSFYDECFGVAVEAVSRTEVLIL